MRAFAAVAACASMLNRLRKDPFMLALLPAPVRQPARDAAAPDAPCVASHVGLDLDDPQILRLPIAALAIAIALLADERTTTCRISQDGACVPVRR